MPAGHITANRTELAGIRRLRDRFLEESSRQVRYDAVHARGLSDSYLLHGDGAELAYGSIMAGRSERRDTVFEYYVIPEHRADASRLFERLLSVSGASRIECQSNDVLLSHMLFEFARNICADVVLFEAGVATAHVIPGAVFRLRTAGDRVFEHSTVPVGDYVVELGGEIVATGGFLLHYNEPFADLHMEVDPRHRGRGIGRFLVQEVIRACCRAGRVPAARCNIDNVASRATLTSAGLKVCGFMLTGDIHGRFGDAPTGPG